MTLSDRTLDAFLAVACGLPLTVALAVGWALGRRWPRG